MIKKSKKTVLIGALLVLVLAIGAVGVFAQGDDGTDAENTTVVPEFRGPGRGGFPHGDSDEYQAELADALGITVEELQAAQQRVREVRIEQMVEDGILTRDQANLMLATDALKDYVDRDALMAEVLGISVEEYQAAREAGTLHNLLADITPAELQERMQQAYEATLQQAVEDNIITSEQADLIREQMDGRFGFGPHMDFGFGGHGHHGGFGGHGMRNFSAPVAPDTDSNTSSNTAFFGSNF
jgi:hypothetical protein